MDKLDRIRFPISNGTDHTVGGLVYVMLIGHRPSTIGPSYRDGAWDGLGGVGWGTVMAAYIAVG